MYFSTTCQNLPDPDAHVVAYGTAWLGGAKKAIHVRGGWQDAFGLPHACAAGPLVFVAGQMALDRELNVLARGDHCGQSRIAYRGMLAAVAQAGGSVADIIDFTSFHHDIRGADDTLPGTPFKPSSKSCLMLQPAQ